jgi:hypothetical protein
MMKENTLLLLICSETIVEYIQYVPFPIVWELISSDGVSLDGRKRRRPYHPAVYKQVNTTNSILPRSDIAQGAFSWELSRFCEESSRHP